MGPDWASVLGVGRRKANQWDLEGPEIPHCQASPGHSTLWAQAWLVKGAKVEHTVQLAPAVRL